jgi:uncharacterized protein
MPTMNSVFKRIVIFFAVAYAFTWFGNLGNWLWPSGAWPVPMMPLGPFLAALVVIGFADSWAGLKTWLLRCVNFGAPIWVYAAAFFIPLAIIMASAGLAILLGTPHGPLPVYTPLEYVMFLPLVLIDGPAPEELSFRGFGQHELQNAVSPLAASLWIGLGVLIWHLPVLMRQDIPWPIAIAIIAVSVIYAWLYIAGGSIWPVVTLHFVQNYFGGGYFGRLFSPADSVPWTAILTLLYALWAMFLAWKFGSSLGRRPP